MSVFPKYPKYKDSGVEWLGEIPEHWEVRKIFQIFQNISSGTTPKDERNYIDGVIPWIMSGDLNNNYLYVTKKRVNFEAIKNYSTLKIYPENSLIIAMYGATIGKISITKINACTNQACCALSRPIENINIEFIFHLFIKLRPYLILIGYGGGQPNISQNTIKSLRIPIPPRKEQQIIANFLNWKTIQINKFVRSKKKLIQLLKEEKQAIINHAVTKGLNPDAPLKNSGVEWLGEIPEHWKVRKLKSLLQIKNGQDYKYVEDISGFPVIGSGGQFAYSSQFLYDGESVLFGRKGTIDKPLYINGKFWTVDTMFYTEISSNVHAKFIYFCALIFPFDRYKTKTAIPSMTQRDLGNHSIAFPPISEQQAIADYLNQKTAEIDLSISRAEKEIALIEEYKTRLISDAVTGKIDVRGIEVPEYDETELNLIEAAESEEDETLDLENEAITSEE